MCMSKLGQIVFGALAACAIGLTLASMFTPGWRKIEAELENGTTDQQIRTISSGIFSFTCKLDNATTQNDGNNETFDVEAKIKECENWFKNQPTFEKVVIALMFGALLFATASFVLNLLTFCCCTGMGCAHRPLPSAAGAATLCLFAALTLFYMKNNNKIAIAQSLEYDPNLIKQNDMNYSFYLGVGALVCNLANMLLGSFIVATAEKCI